MPIQLKTKITVEEKAQSYGHVFAIKSSRSAKVSLENRVYKYDGDKFKHWENYKNRDFPNANEEEPF